MIVVVGSPAWRAVEPVAPAGRACAIALSAAAAGATVEIVGRVGDDPAGDALLLALTRGRVGHAAMLRDPARPTPVIAPPPEPVDDDAASPFAGERDGRDGRAPGHPTTAGPRLEPADVTLAVRYLDPSGVIVVTDDVPPDALAAAVDAGRFAGTRLVVLVPPGTPPDRALPAELPVDATVLAAPDELEAEPGAFEALVGAYAAALDRGEAPEAAFASAAGAGWESLAASG